MDGNSCTYAYHNNHILKTAQDIDGYQIVYSYYNNTSTTESYKPVRVQKIQEKYKTGTNSWTAKGYQDIVYTDKQTTITDHNSNVQVRMFNDFGNLRSVQDDEGRAQYYKYLVNNTGETGDATQLSLSSKLQYTVTNVLLNGSFEEESASEWSVDTTQASGTFTVSADHAYLGSHSLKVIGSNGLGKLNGPSITVQPGETYTLSAYIKTVTGMADLGFYRASDHAGLMYSPPPASMGTGWDRHQVTYTNSTTSPVTVYIGIGFLNNSTFYVDCLQLEKAETASRYNLVIDGDFRYGASEWTRSNEDNEGNTEDNSIVVYDTDPDNTGENLAAPQLDSNAIQITGTPLEKRSISQEIPISGEEGDTFVIAGWAKGESVALTENEDYPRQYGIVGTFHYTDGTTKDFVAQFNPNMSTANKWQYASDVMVAEKAYSSITVKAAYDHNLNTALFDGIQLYKEEFGNSYTYDDDGNVTSVKDLQKQITTYEYSNNNLVKEILPSGAELSYTYDDYHNVIEAKSTTNVTYKFTYDTYGNNTAVYIPHADGSVGIESEATYANNGNTLASTTDALGNVTQYVYDADTNVLKSVKYPNDEANDPNTTARDGNETYYDYDEMFRTEKVFSTTDSNLALSAIYTYGENNDLLTQIKTPSTDYNFDYNTYGLRSGVRVDSQNLATYTYTATNFYLEQLAYSNGDRVQYTYDTKGRLTQQRYEDNTYVSYKYDNSGALARTYDSARGIKTTYFYDLTDRLVGYVEADIPGNFEHSVGYTYDDINNLTALVERINGSTYTTSYTYDTDNRITSVTNGNASKSYTYDSYGRAWTLTTKHNGTTVKTDTFDFMPRGTTNQTSSQIKTHTVNIGGINTVYTYTYDANGNITSITGGGNTVTYAYDSANQLIREDNLAGDYTHTWTYDNAGNIVARKEYDYASAETEPSGNGNTVGYTYDRTSDWGDVLRSYDDHALSYDSVGNLTDDGTWKYDWQHGRQLDKMTEKADDTKYWDYTYNADGLRTKRTNGTKTYEYIYNGSQLSQMTVDGKTLYFAYDASGTPMSVTYNGTTYYYVTNIQGDVTAILNSSGTEVVSYTYDTWGNPLANTGSLADDIGTHNPLRYRGYVYDQETGFYYLQSRYYNPEIGRFINADNQLSTGDMTGMNLFAYCGNNPVTRIDPTGHAWGHWLLGAVIVAGFAVATVVTCGSFAAAATAVCMVGSGVAAATTASTIAAGAFIGSATVYGMAVLTAASNSNSVEEFRDQGNWGTVAATAGGAILGGYNGYNMSTTTVYRSVSEAEAQSIRETGQFTCDPRGMESKQFGFNFAETKQFGNMVGQHTIVSARVPNSMINQLYTGGVDTSIFRHGTLTVYLDQLPAFNQSIIGSIKIMP